jgi:ankyrin repeat protein
LNAKNNLKPVSLLKTNNNSSELLTNKEKYNTDKKPIISVTELLNAKNNLVSTSLFKINNNSSELLANEEKYNIDIKSIISITELLNDKNNIKLNGNDKILNYLLEIEKYIENLVHHKNYKKILELSRSNNNFKIIVQNYITVNKINDVLHCNEMKLTNCTKSDSIRCNSCKVYNDIYNNIKTIDSMSSTFIYYLEIIENNSTFDPNFIFLDINNESLLTLAAYNGNFQFMKYLIENGGDINYQNNLKMSALHYIIIYNPHINVVKYLLDKGANPKIKNKNNESPLFCAIKTNKSEEIALLLIQRGADVNEKNNNQTILSYAIKYKMLKVIDIMISMDVDVQGYFEKILSLY